MKKPYPFEIVSVENYNNFFTLRVCYQSSKEYERRKKKEIVALHVGAWIETKEYVYEFNSEYAVRKILQFIKVKNFRKAKLFLDKFNTKAMSHPRGCVD